MIDFKKYKWFYTSSGKLVVGGKSAIQNDELLKKVTKGEEKYVMHTSDPGSPFCVILSENATKKDLEECAIFTGCFSRAWKMKKSKTIVDIFTTKQLVKEKGMKEGSWRVTGIVKHVPVKLKLYLGEQEGVLRALPYKNGKNIIEIVPGDIDKGEMAVKIKDKLGVKMDEILAALPAGGFK